MKQPSKIAFRETFLEFRLDNCQASLFEDTPKLVILPVDSQEYVSSEGDGMGRVYLPSDTTVNLIKHVTVYRAEILFYDDDSAVRI